MNIPTKYGFGSTPKADNKIRIKGSTDYILLLCVILLTKKTYLKMTCKKCIILLRLFLEM